MTIDDVLNWIAKKSGEYALMIPNSNDCLQEIIGGIVALESLRFHILMKTNPHNREDIRKYNERENNE
jgi:hypothetical protein